MIVRTVRSTAYVGLIAVAMFGAQRTPSCVGSKMMRHQLATKVMEIQSDVLSFIRLPVVCGISLDICSQSQGKR